MHKLFFLIVSFCSVKYFPIGIACGKTVLPWSIESQTINQKHHSIIINFLQHMGNALLGRYSNPLVYMRNSIPSLQILLHHLCLIGLLHSLQKTIIYSNFIVAPNTIYDGQIWGLLFHPQESRRQLFLRFQIHLLKEVHKSIFGGIFCSLSCH